MPNYIYEFIQDSEGSCTGCTGGCENITPSTGGTCFTCISGTGTGTGCIYYKCVCTSGDSPRKVPCSVLMDFSGCINKYTYKGLTGNCFYEACDDTVYPDLGETQIFYDLNEGQWKTLGYPPQDDFFTRADCSPLGAYAHPSGWPLEVTICTWCSGCDCGPSGDYGSGSSGQRGGDGFLDPPCSSPLRTEHMVYDCGTAMCWDHPPNIPGATHWPENAYAIYKCILWQSVLPGNTETPGESSSWVYGTDCCTGVPTGCGPVGWHSNDGCIDA